jgi:selenocysteine lyase
MSSDTSSSSELTPSNVKPRRKAPPPSAGRALKQAKKPPLNADSEDESDECTESDLRASSSSNASSDEVGADGASIIYMDYNATTPLDRDVLAAIHRALKSAWGNPSSSYHAGVKAKSLVAESRQFVAAMIGAAADEIIFTSGGTEANNMVLSTAVEHFRRTRSMSDHTRPHIISTTLEHDSIKLVLEQYQKCGTADVTFVDAVKDGGCVRPDDIVAAIQPSTCLVSVMLANNETGVLQPLASISARLKQYCMELSREPIFLHTDAAQAIGKIPVNVSALGVDYLTIVGHKFYGPRIGALYTHHLGQQTPLYPMFYGGGQERNYRPGTENTGMIAGLGKACEIVTRNIDRYHSHLTTVRDYLEQKLLDAFPQQVHFNGKAEGVDRLPNTCNVSFIGSQYRGYRVVSLLKRVQASIGAACHSQLTDRASPVLLTSGVPEEVALNAIRLSIGRGTTLRDIDIVIEDFKRVITEMSGHVLTDDAAL